MNKSSEWSKSLLKAFSPCTNRVNYAGSFLGTVFHDRRASFCPPQEYKHPEYFYVHFYVQKSDKQYPDEKNFLRTTSLNRNATRS